MSGRHFLFVPGPTNVPERILRAMDRAQDDHRASTFRALTRSVLADLPKVFGTGTGRPFIFPASGSGMWEASIMNALNPGDRVLAFRNGQFSHLFIEAARKLGMNVEALDGEWGRGISADAVGAALKADVKREFKAVLLVHNETATGVTNDIAAVRRAINASGHDALLMVDGVSSIASLEFRMEDWGVDFAIAGSQKGFMMPAGLGLLCVSPKGLRASETATSPRAFFDLRSQIPENDLGSFPYTPAGAHLHGLRESLDMLLEEGMPAVAARHRRLATGVRKAVHAWGLHTCAVEPNEQSNTVTAVVVPDGADADKVREIAFDRYNLAVGAGLGRLRGRAFRIGHLGDLNDLMLLGALAGIEMAMADAGIRLRLGSGVAAAQEWYRANPPGQ